MTFCFKNSISPSCLKNMKVKAQTKDLMVSMISMVFKRMDSEEVKESSHFKASSLSFLV